MIKDKDDVQQSAHEDSSITKSEKNNDLCNNFIMPKVMIHKTLSMLMEKEGLTFRKLAEKTGISASTLKSWTNQDVSPRNLEEVYKVAKELGVSFEYLIFGESEKPSSLNELPLKQIFSGWIKVDVKAVIPEDAKIDLPKIK